MPEHDGSQEALTRRNYVKLGSAAVGGTLLAGCTGSGESTGEESSTDETDMQADSSHTVSMEPMGTVSFDGVPETWVPYGGDYADMGVALGQADGLLRVGNAGEYYTDIYDELPGVSVDSDILEKESLIDNGMSKELFYEMEADVHIIDPVMLKNWFDWSDGDVEEIRDGVAPFFGNMIFRWSDGWHEHRYYTLYQAFEKMAELFDEQERYEAFETLHDEYISSIQARLPPTADRPNVMLTYELSDEPSEFTPYRLIDQGTSKKQWNDLGVGDALAGTGIENLSTENRTKLDYENLLEVDPDVLLIRGHEQKTATEFRETVLAYMQDHSVASELTAVQNGRVYRGGPLRQGPIQNLLNTERAAKQLFPDEFGDVTGDNELFDRQRVADIVTGEF
ncbi:ABC transporter substrate-binding protein [Halovenus salina]|uniref:ABC transporter substrate-binding protein n=1 Tax=Halovenus salina TaxID=1510225 RepID=A0ABD5W6M7_9EURY|nr:ABC transporter substrate-binding protein [Halovenus salina]